MLHLLTRLPLTLALLGAPLFAAPTPDPQTAQFTTPTAIDNVWAPFHVDSVKVHRGRNSGKRTASVVRHLPDTRVFSWAGQLVNTRVLEERDFRAGQLEEIALTYLAQDDDGNVHMFGEVSKIYEDGLLVEVEDDSWLVGGPQSGDPEGVRAVDDPALFMLGAPKVGDTIVQETFGEHPETLTVLRFTKLRVSAGKFTNVIKLREDDGEAGSAPPQYLWVAAGVGPIKTRAKGEKSQLIATSLVELSELD